MAKLVLFRLRRGKQGQRLFRVLARSLKRKRHRRELCVRLCKARTQSLCCRQLDGAGCFLFAQCRLDPCKSLIFGRRFGLRRCNHGLQSRLLRAKVGTLGPQSLSLALSQIALRQKARHLRFKGSHLRFYSAQRLVLRLCLGPQSCDQSRLFARPGACRLKRHTKLTNPRLKPRGLALFKPKCLRQLGNFGIQLVHLAFLPRDRLTQHELNDHKDGQNKHQNKQKPRHRIDKPRPDIGLKALPGAAGKGHKLALVSSGVGRLLAHAQLANSVWSLSAKYLA